MRLGIAMGRSGAAELMGVAVASTADLLPVLVVLWLFYVGTGLVTEVISNNASVVLMIPVGVETAQGIGANPFVFVLAVTFAASTAFLGPIGYQTNLIVYGPGGYRSPTTSASALRSSSCSRRSPSSESPCSGASSRDGGHKPRPSARLTTSASAGQSERREDDGALAESDAEVRHHEETEDRVPVSPAADARGTIVTAS